MQFSVKKKWKKDRAEFVQYYYKKINVIYQWSVIREILFYRSRIFSRFVSLNIAWHQIHIHLEKEKGLTKTKHSKID